MSIAITADGALRTLKIDRPKKANALDDLTVEALREAVVEASRSASPFALASDGKVFCGGFDFTDVENQSHGDLLKRFVDIEALLQAVAYAPVATIALVGGAAFGAGADLAAACTYRIASPNATFRFPGFRFGVALGTRRLLNLVGTDTARAILLENKTVTAEEALKLGLVTHVVEQSEFEATAAALLEAHRGLSAESTARILTFTTPDTRDADLADLVRSLAPSGLHERIARYRAGHR
ncbi:enoyl-CoA hydratase/carnithine racemase [Methylopila capsulata]|uniref:Enoyl-CoA hydratase/carnithine racemase n=1 Tax=Methylopila capsulata TaxID=61654 RepID=A0ABS2T7P5_9HYPH|nr:enoyl-CoA hydratase/isomerase family protein [Methylopila capsulata]MBM7852203.1 enoyl-CoA hydratase/carnithine racemase [Methylopila capsulata]